MAVSKSAKRPVAAKATKATPSKSAQGKSAQAPKTSATRDPDGPDLVVGTVPIEARVAGGLGALGALFLLISPFLPYASAAGEDYGAGNLFDVIAALPLLVAAGGAGVLAALGRLPRMALAVLLVTGTLGLGALLQTQYLRGGGRSSIDLPLGLGTSFAYDAGARLTFQLVGYLLLVLAGLVAGWAWSRTVMEDGGSLDGFRPLLAAAGLIVGVLAGLALSMAPYDGSGNAQGPPPVLERDGLNQLGGIVLALGTAVWAVVAATLRPRLAVVGAYLGLAGVLAASALGTALLVKRSPALEASFGGGFTLVGALAFGGLAVLALRLRGRAR